jgi:hypothetical protein
VRKSYQSLPAPRRISAPHGMTPTILAHAGIVTVLVSASWDTWHDQWMAQAIDEMGIDYFDDVFRMFTPAAVGMATTALRAHIDAHHALYEAAGVAIFVEPLPEQDDAIVCTFGLFETIHEELEDEDDAEFPRFIETVEHYTLLIPAYRDDDTPFPGDAFALGDAFFSAVDQTTIIGDATLADIKAHPEQYALVDVQVTTIYARAALPAREEDDDDGEPDVALTA